MMNRYIFILLYSVMLPVSFGSNILVVFPHISYCHFKATSKLVTELEIRGHNVTFVSPYQIEANDSRNITEISVHGILDPIEKLKADFIENHNGPSSFWSKLQYAKKIGSEYARQVLHNPNITDLINSNSVFDLVLVEDVSADALTIFSYIFKCPLSVLLSEPLSVFYDNYFLGDVHWKKLNDIRNMHHFAIKELYREWMILPEQNRIIKDLFPAAPDVREILFNTNLVLIPSYPALSSLVPKYLNVKQIGGFHIGNSDQIPTDIQTILNHSRDGVIVVSDGVEKTDLEVLLNSTLSDILWMDKKCGGEILANPNVKLFVGNGDIYGAAQAIENNVPILSVVYNRWFQQFLTDRLIEDNAAFEIPVDKLNFEYLQNVINYLTINNTRYQENIKIVSKIISTQQTRPMDEAVFWIEYIINFNGAHHLRPYDLKRELEKNLIYTIIILVIIDVLLFLLFYWIIKHFLAHKKYSTVRNIFYRNDKLKGTISYIPLQNTKY